MSALPTADQTTTAGGLPTAPAPVATMMATSSLVALLGRLGEHRALFTRVVIVQYLLLVGGAGIAVLSVRSAAAAVTTTSNAALLVGVLGALVVVVGVLAWTESWLSHVLAYRAIDTLRLAVHAALARLAPLGLGRRRSGATAAAAMSDLEAMEWFFAHTLGQLLAGTVAAITLSAGTALVFGWPGLVVLLAQLGVLAIPLVAAPVARRQGRALRAAIADLSATVVEGRRSARELVLLGLLDQHRQDLREATGQVQSVRRRTAARTGAEQAAQEAIVAAAVIAMLLVALRLVAGGDLQRVDVPVCTVLVGAGLAPVLAMVAGLQRLGEMNAAAARVAELLEAPATRALGGRTDLQGPREQEGAVRVEELQVRYPGSGATVLSGLDASIAPGEQVALVGASGAGKTTLLHTLARLFEPAAGQVVVDGIAVAGEDPERTRRRVALVGQHPHLFRSSVRANLLLADPARSDTELWQTLGVVGLADFVAALPGGLDSAVAENGATWSGGQRQRLGLARGLLVEPSVLLLDEPTAHLDAASELAVMTALATARRGRTTVIASHRPSTVRRCGRVLLLDGGRVVADGSHERLLATEPAYAALLARADQGSSPESGDPDLLLKPVR